LSDINAAFIESKRFLWGMVRRLGEGLALLVEILLIILGLMDDAIEEWRSSQHFGDIQSVNRMVLTQFSGKICFYGGRPDVA
jgi:hypothetical protein